MPTYALVTGENKVVLLIGSEPIIQLDDEDLKYYDDERGYGVETPSFDELNEDDVREAPQVDKLFDALYEIEARGIEI